MSGRAYYETTPMTKEQLDAAFKVAAAQDDLVLATYRTAAHLGVGLLSPSQVHAVGVKRGNDWLLTSVRRSIVTLTRAQVLEKTDIVRMGPYGRQEYCWQLAECVKGV